MIFAYTSPTVSMPSESGVTSSSRRLLTSPPITPACSAAPIATHSSGLMPLKGSLPVKRRTASCTAGMRLEPPTISTLESDAGVSPESAIACCTGPIVISTRWRVSSSNLARVSVVSMCSGPFLLAVRNGRLMLAEVIPDNSIFAFSAASRMRCMAVGSLRRSILFSRLNSSSR